ncbi:MAG: bifunctional diaminohydroxyphosphoribosylaminopyrimidine deaminase/5-amino-6-(5-phosphoribosylamino)uracil reductase RibD [Acidobacteria bacterium]|nr:bifunctional diaminohydroxyphosphoribosylaminopyrimidine deaminase/5-amino-6-(5-phosphoribosylamino)uracil reductase RibD [Acidobacteriota bacterium]
MESNHSEFDVEMTRCALELAARGVGLVSPSPLVGCVVVSKSGEIVGEGSYEFEKVTHAEVLALEQAGERARGGTAYVSLEPHSHHGRTSPCTDALIGAGIRRVVCPIEDPNPLVSGEGFERLRVAGIEVVTGLLRDEAERLNEKFCVWHNKRRPFVHLKLAMSLDARISLRSSISTAISGPESSKRVHEIRHEHDAILVGGNTVAVDDPSLTDRSGKPRRRRLVRVVLDNRLQIPVTSNVVADARETPTIVISNSEDSVKIALIESKGVDLVRVDARDLSAVLDELRKREIQSVLVEGGPRSPGHSATPG